MLQMQRKAERLKKKKKGYFMGLDFSFLDGLKYHHTTVLSCLVHSGVSSWKHIHPLYFTSWSSLSRNNKIGNRKKEQTKPEKRSLLITGNVMCNGETHLSPVMSLVETAKKSTSRESTIGKMLS